MSSNIVWRSNLYIVLLVAFAFLLTSCRATGRQNELAASGETSDARTATIPPTSTIEFVITPTTLSVPETPEQNEASLVMVTATPSVTAPVLPTPTHTPIPSPTATDVPCNSVSNLPGKAFPTQIDMTRSHNQRVAISYPFLYLAVEQYIGVFDISDPASPQFRGFWNFPDWPSISTLQVHNGVAYFTSGSTLVIVNLSSQCQFEIITTIEIPFQIFQLEIEGNRLYVDEVSVDIGKNQVAIFSIADPSQPQELGTVDLGQIAIWSVFNEIIYSLGNELTVFDVSDPTNPRSKPVNLTLDAGILAYSPSAFFKDHLYLLWESHTLTIISQMQNESPIVRRNPQKQIVMGDLTHFAYQVSEDYIFLGGYSCDVSCGSYVTFFNAEDGQALSGLGFQDHQSLIHSYYEIRSDIIYAFTDDSLLVIDISDISEPVIITEVSLIT